MLRGRGFNHSETAIFLHIPKTAGTTLSRIIRRQYRPGQRFEIAQEISPHSGPAAMFADFAEERRNSFRLIYGHLAFGLHRHISSPTTYFTMLREPYRLLRSLYSHARWDKNHNLHNDIGRMSLAEVLESEIAQVFDNFQTRAISGRWHDVPYGACDEGMLTQAKENLRHHFAVVGVMERFDEVLLLLQERFGWGQVYYAKQNVAKGRDNRESLSPETRSLLDERNHLDVELYRFAAALCAEKIAQMGPDFVQRVQRFQRINQILSVEDKLYWEMRKLSLRQLWRK